MTTKLNSQQIPAARELLTAPRTYYVSPTGNDSSNGLTTGTAFATMSKAMSVIVNTLDLGGQIVTIQLMDGTHTGNCRIDRSWIGGDVVIQGNSASPQNVFVNTTNNAFYVLCSLQGSLTVKDMRIASNCSIYHYGAGIIYFSNIIFAAATTYHIFAENNGAIVICNGNYQITGNAQVHAFATTGGVINIRAKTITLSAGVTFTYFAYASRQGILQLDYNTWTNGASAIGSRYVADYLGLIFVAAASSTYLPGSTAGTVGAGGLYA